MSSNKIKQAVDNLKATYNTNNPFVICDHLGITVRERNFNESRKAYFVSIFGQPSITINSNYIEKSKNILCAHELGHIILGHTGVNNFESENQEAEREANLFALYMLFDEDDFDMKFENMTSYLIKYTLDRNIKLASKY